MAATKSEMSPSPSGEPGSSSSAKWRTLKAMPHIRAAVESHPPVKQASPMAQAFGHAESLAAQAPTPQELARAARMGFVYSPGMGFRAKDVPPVPARGDISPTKRQQPNPPFLTQDMQFVQSAPSATIEQYLPLTREGLRNFVEYSRERHQGALAQLPALQHFLERDHDIPDTLHYPNGQHQLNRYTPNEKPIVSRLSASGNVYKERDFTNVDFQVLIDTVTTLANVDRRYISPDEARRVEDQLTAYAQTNGVQLLKPITIVDRIVRKERAVAQATELMFAAVQFTRPTKEHPLHIIDGKVVMQRDNPRNPQNSFVVNIDPTSGRIVFGHVTPSGTERTDVYQDQDTGRLTLRYTRGESQEVFHANIDRRLRETVIQQLQDLQAFLPRMKMPGTVEEVRTVIQDNHHLGQAREVLRTALRSIEGPTLLEFMANIQEDTTAPSWYVSGSNRTIAFGHEDRRAIRFGITEDGISVAVGNEEDGWTNVTDFKGKNRENILDLLSYYRELLTNNMIQTAKANHISSSDMNLITIGHTILGGVEEQLLTEAETDSNRHLAELMTILRKIHEQNSPQRPPAPVLRPDGRGVGEPFESEPSDDPKNVFNEWAERERRVRKAVAEGYELPKDYGMAYREGMTVTLPPAREIVWEEEEPWVIHYPIRKGPDVPKRIRDMALDAIGDFLRPIEHGIKNIKR